MLYRRYLITILCFLAPISAHADNWGAGRWGTMSWGSGVFEDTDLDGVSDATDNCANSANEDQVDSDDDGVGDICDVFPFDSSEQSDTDGDGIGDRADNDDDNDGISDAYDADPLTENSVPASWQVFQNLIDKTETVRRRD